MRFQARYARSLVGESEEKQEEILEKIVRKGLTVAQTEKLIKEEKKEKKTKKGFTRDIKVAVNTIRQAFGMIARFNIKATLKEKEDDDGYTMTIHFPKE